MKKLVLFLLCLVFVASAANVKLDVLSSMKKYNCELTSWKENIEVKYVQYKHYAEITCKEPKAMPVKIAGLKFIDVSASSGNYIYRYGD